MKMKKGQKNKLSLINRTMSGLQDRASIVHVELHPGQLAMYLLTVFEFLEEHSGA